MLWWIVGVMLLLLLLGALVPGLVGRSERKREKRLNHRAKRRIEL